MERSPADSHRIGLLYVATAGLLWSTSGLFIKALPLSAWQIAGYRSLLAVLALVVFAKVRKEPLGLRLDANLIAAALAYTVVLVAFVVATKLTTAANAIFLQFTAPIYLLVLEPKVLGTPFRRRDLVAVIACVAGMSLFFMGKLEGGRLLGNLLGLLSGVCLATFSLLLKQRAIRHPGESPVGAIVLGNILVFLVCLPFLARQPIPTPPQGLALVFLGIIQLGLAYRLYAAGIRHVSATAAMITSMMEAVFNPLWVFLGTGELPSLTANIGGLIIFGVVVGYSLWGKTSEPAPC